MSWLVGAEHFYVAERGLQPESIPVQAIYTRREISEGLLALHARSSVLQPPHALLLRQPLPEKELQRDYPKTELLPK